MKGKKNARKRVTDPPPQKRRSSKPASEAFSNQAATPANRFIVEKRLGTGGLCEVFHCADTLRTSWGNGNDGIALKVIMPGYRNNPKAGMLLMQEFAIASALSHPNIIRVHDMHEGPWGLGLSMEPLSGVSVKDLIHHYPQGMGRAVLPWAMQLFSTIDYLHKRGIAHGDIKPGNICIEAGRRLVLFDFNSASCGLQPGCSGQTSSRSLRQELHLTSFTPLYASPERIETGEPSLKDDIFAAACTLFHLAHGHRPYPAATALEAKKHTIAIRPPILPLPEPLHTVLRQALSLHAKQRPDSQQCLQALSRKPFFGRFSFFNKPCLPLSCCSENRAK